MEIQKGVDTSSPKVDGNKFPKLAKATELANNYKIRAEKAEAENKKIKAKAPEVKPSKKSSKKTKGFDYGQLAYLESKGVTNEKDQEYLLAEVENTGKELKDVLEFKYVKEELAGFKDDRASTDAIPDGTKRSTQTSRDKVDYWIAKDEMPPADQQQLRRDYVNAKIKKAEDSSKFTDRPVVQ